MSHMGILQQLTAGNPNPGWAEQSKSTGFELRLF